MIPAASDTADSPTSAELENLNRAECAQRRAVIGSVNYTVDLDLSLVGGPDASPTFGSTTLVEFEATEGASTWIDLIAPTVHSIELNGQQLDPSEVFNGARIQLDNLQERNSLTVVADCLYMRSGEGLHRFVDPVDDETYLYTQFEVADSRRMYTCFEQPSLKATFQLSVNAPSHWEVVSNSPTPEAVKIDDAISRWEFERSALMSTYITALVAGPYHVVRDEYVGPHGTYPLGIFCRKSLADHLDADDIFELTKQGFEFYEKTFDMPYSFGKYDQLFVPEFNAGAMENAGCVTFLEDYVFRSRVTDAAYEQRANTILHELAHMWFGNLVTMEWWDDLWLNESFAEWASHYANAEATRYKDAWTTFQNQRKAWAYRQDQLPSTHPIAADMSDLEAVRVNFDGITYAKGASALRQLVAWVGEEQFCEGIKAYFKKHAWGNTELSDLLDALEESSGRELRSWSKQWLETTGVNTVTPEVLIAEDGTYSHVALLQTPPTAPDGVDQLLRDHRIGVGLYNRSGNTLKRNVRAEVDLVGDSVGLDELDGLPRAEILLPNDGDLTFAKIRLDDHSAANAVASAHEVDDSLARALLWGAAWDMTRDAEMPTREFLTMVTRGVATEPDVGVVQQVLRQLHLAIDLYADPHKRDLYQESVAESMYELLATAEPGSDHQLAFARAFVGYASTELQLTNVEELLNGSTTFTGLTIDTDLRWSILARLVQTARAGTSEIEAEQERDQTAQGIKAATACFASIPTAEAKVAAWDTALNDPDIANHLLAATIDGINVPSQRELLRPHVDEYFESIDRVWKNRTPEMAQQVVAGLYPVLLVDAETVTHTEAFLNHNPNLAPGAKRLVNEGLDAVLRAMRCQERDAR
ncbi:MAG: aminopeptidase N [Candidatus Nanopelagicales bacterium]